MYPMGFQSNVQSPAPPMQSPYTWVPASCGTVPPGGVVGGRDGNDDLYVGRAHHNDELLPGKVFPKHRVCYVAHKGKEHAKSNYQVLCGSNLKWVSTTGRTIPPGAVVGGGCHEGGETLYVGRANHHGNYVVGKVQPSHGCCYIAYGGKEHAYKVYEVLVYNENELTRTSYPQAMMAPIPPMQYQYMNQQMYSPYQTQPIVASNVPMYQQAPMVSMANPSPLQWVDSINGNIPHGAFHAGRETHNELYVARAYHGDELIPGKGHPEHRVCYVAWGGEEHAKNDFQVLCGRNFTWVRNSGPFKPSNAIPGGRASDGETLYIGRVNHHGSHALGKVQLSHQTCYIPYGGKEHGYKNYEILVS